MTDTAYQIQGRIESASLRYGPFASTHEAMGVALEEWDEFRAAIHENKIESAKTEAMDLAAVLIRFANQAHWPRG